MIIAAANLAVLDRKMGRYNAAAPLYDEVADRAAATLASDSTENLCALNNAGLFFDELGQRARARDLFERALSGIEAKRGLRHHDYMRGNESLAQRNEDRTGQCERGTGR